MATVDVTISGLTNSDIRYDPDDKVKDGDTVNFTLDLEDYTVSITWDSGCPMTDSDNISINGNSLTPNAGRTVSSTAPTGTYHFTVSFQAIVPPHTQEEPEEPPPTHGGLEVSREN